MSLPAFLESHELFRRLSGLEREHLAESTELRTVRPDTVLYRQDEPTDGMYILVSGAVELSRMNRQGHRFVLARLQRADIFGDLSILDHGPRPVTATVTDEGEAEVAHVRAQALDELVAKRDRAALELIHILSVQASRRLRELNRAIVETINEPTALGGETMSGGTHRPDAAFFHGLMAGLYTPRRGGG